MSQRLVPQGAADRTAKEIAAQIRTAAEEHGWI
jgi:hypothetical protein